MRRINSSIISFLLFYPFDFMQLNISEMARQMGINKSLLSKYIYGIKKTSERRRLEIRQALHKLGEELMKV